MKAAHAAKLLKMQSENHKQAVSLLQTQVMLLTQERDKHENTLSSQVTNMYREKDKDRADKDKDRIAAWGQGQQTLAMAMSMNNGNTRT